MTFEELNIRPEIVRALKEDGINSPTKIQRLAIPAIIEGKDVIGVSNTGSGKTVAFGVPLLETLRPKEGLQVLIMTPTRELAVQIKRELIKFSRNMKYSITTVYGGVSMGPQIEKVAKADIVVGTTGRLLDILKRGYLDLSRLRTVVLDEADKMVEMGFIEDIEEILKKVPKNKQVLLFGATISDEINQIKKRHMKSPLVAKADSYVREDFLEQYYYDVGPGEKFSFLVHLLKKEDTKRVIIFCSTRASVEILTRNLKENGVKVEMIHGKLTQSRRQKIIDNFNKGNPNVLVASAVAARGLDIRNVSHVFNYSLSQDPQEYIHRVGRTARAGESGKAITLLESRDHEAFSMINARYSLNVKKLDKGEFTKLRFNAKAGKRSRGGYRVSRGSFQRNNKPRFSARGGRPTRRSGLGNSSARENKKSNDQGWGSINERSNRPNRKSYRHQARNPYKG